MEDKTKLNISKVLLAIVSIVALFFMFAPTSKYCGEFGCLFTFSLGFALGSILILPLLGVTAYYSVKSGRLTKQQLWKITFSILIIIALILIATFLSAKINALDESTGLYAAIHPFERSQIYTELSSDILLTTILFGVIFIIAGLLLFKFPVIRNGFISGGLMTLASGIFIYGISVPNVTGESLVSMITRASFFGIFSIIILVYTYISINKEK